MKYVAITTIIFLSTLQHTFAQNHFSNLYGDFDLSEFGDEIHLFDDYIVTITEANPPNSSNHIFIRKVSQNGDLISENIIKNDSLGFNLFAHGKSFIKDSILYFISVRKENFDGFTLDAPVLLKYNLVYDELIFFKIYRSRIYSGGVFSAVIKDGYIYGIGQAMVDLGVYSGLIVKLDLEGNLIWDKTIGYGDWDDAIWDIKSLGDNLIITGSEFNEDEEKESFLAKIDTTGAIIKKISDTEGDNFNDNIEVYDKSIYYCATKGYGEDVTANLQMYNEDLDLQWNITLTNFNKFGIYKIKTRVLDNQMFITGIVNDALKFTNNKRWAYAASFTLDGAFNWEHVYPYSDEFDSRIDNIEVMPRNGLVFIGGISYSDTIDSRKKRKPWLFSTDSLGCRTLQETCYYTLDDYFMLDTATNIFEPQFSNAAPVEILGNPFTTNLQLKALDNKPLQLQFYNTEGQLVTTKKISGQLTISTQSWPKGIYFMQVFDKAQLLGVEKLVKQ